MKDVIKKIISGEELERIFSFVLDNLFRLGPVSVTDLEILSYLAYYQPIEFEKRRNAVLNYMAIFYKNINRNTLKDVVFGQYRRYIRDNYERDYTPVQADIVKHVDRMNCFSFSAPTSTGKSFVFMDKIKSCTNDVVVIVPSRALINEYYLKLSELIPDKTINILTFIDKINTKAAQKNIFIVTPERCRELFKQKDLFHIDMFLFDEAQLSSEDSKRGLYFDSIVRRCQKAFPQSKFVFAHPFVKNPESQIQKNHFEEENSFAYQYTQKNVGQMFFCCDEQGIFHHFGIEQNIMGKQRQPVNFDPVENTIKKGGSVLFYVSKAKIYSREILSRFDKYVSLCDEISNPIVNAYIEQLKRYTGGETVADDNHFSLMLSLLKRGIVIHHGSLPLQTRMIIEQFTKEGLCRICFATSTLEQGVNMPFDVVFLDRLEKSKPLSVKNLIGRAGRSTIQSEFDYGFVVLGSTNKMSAFREIMKNDEVLDNISALEKEGIEDHDLLEFRDAIVNGTYSDEYNLTEKDLEKLTAENVEGTIKIILNAIFNEDDLISFELIEDSLERKLSLYANFEFIFASHLGRLLEPGESSVLNTAFKIIFWKIQKKTFKDICWYRYAYTSQSAIRRLYRKAGRATDDLKAKFITPYNDIPDKNLNVFPLFRGKAIEVEYDLVMYDTYDYIDKLIGFKLSDIYYAAFYKYFIKSGDKRSERLAKLLKYGTFNNRHIWMLRYGMTFEDIEILDSHIESVNSEEIVFKPSINEVSENDKASILRFLN